MDGRVHFYGHAEAGANITRKLMTRLKFSNDDIAAVTKLVGPGICGSANISRFGPTLPCAA